MKELAVTVKCKRWHGASVQCGRNANYFYWKENSLKLPQEPGERRTVHQEVFIT